MDSCPTCRSIYQISLQAKILTNSIKKSKTAFIDSMSNSQKEQQISRIKQRINQEPKPVIIEESVPAMDSAKNDAGRKQQKKSRAARFPWGHWHYASTAAGFIVLLIVAAIFISMRGSGGNPFSDLFLNKATRESSSQACAEIAAEYNDSNYAATQKGSTNDAGTRSGTENTTSSSGKSTLSSVSRSTMDSILITPEYGPELAAVIKESAACLEIRNEPNSYMIILVFSSDTIQARVDTIREINQKIEQNNLTTKIEIISGENSQKLVEYTSKENAALLQNAAEKISADFLVITICR